MLSLHILTLPIAMMAFTALYTISIKAPHTVEMASLALWIVLPLLLIAKLSRRSA